MQKVMAAPGVGRPFITLNRKRRMLTTKSLLKHEAEKCKSVPTAREKAESILARMNDMLRDRPFFEVHVENKFNQLNERLHALGWLGLIKTFTR